MVDGIFDKHVEVGQVLRIHEFQEEHDYFPVVNDQKVAQFEVYASELKNPVYVTDNKCHLIGTFCVKLTSDSPKDGKFFLKLQVSAAEIIAVVREETTGQESCAYFSVF